MNEARKQAIADAVDAITRELNGGSRKEVAQAIHERISREHRTLQQSFWSAILLAQIAYADNASDLRNADAVEFAKGVRKLAESKNFDLGGFLYV